MYSYMYRKYNEQPAVELIDKFLSSIKKRYTVKSVKDEKNMNIMVRFDTGKMIILDIPDIKRCNELLFYYIQNVNSYYLNVLKKEMSISMDEVFLGLLATLPKSNFIDFNSHISNINQSLLDESQIIKNESMKKK